MIHTTGELYTTTASGWVYTTNSSRRPGIEKTDNTKVLGIISTNAELGSYGSGWIGCLIVSDQSIPYVHHVDNTGTLTYNGQLYYYIYASGSPSWGGVTTYENPYGFYVTDEYLAESNGGLKVSNVYPIFNRLGLTASLHSMEVPVEFHHGGGYPHRLLHDSRLTPASERRWGE